MIRTTATPRPDEPSDLQHPLFSAGPLFRFPLEGGSESQVLESVYERAFAVTDTGIYFVSPPYESGRALLQFLDFAFRASPGPGRNLCTKGRSELKPDRRAPGLPRLENELSLHVE